MVEAPASSKPTPKIITKVEVVGGPTEQAKKPAVVPTKSHNTIVSSVVQVKSDEEPAAVIGNNIGEPEYDFLSRQPSEVVEETYKVINLKPSTKFHLKHRPTAEVKKAAPRATDSAHPTGLVTKLGGTVVKDGVTTVHETKVIGTYISGEIINEKSYKLVSVSLLRCLLLLKNTWLPCQNTYVIKHFKTKNFENFC